jgi:hypothetical protein
MDMDIDRDFPMEINHPASYWGNTMTMDTLMDIDGYGYRSGFSHGNKPSGELGDYP